MHTLKGNMIDVRDTNNFPNNIQYKVENGLDFILAHFQEPLFPRKIMTKDLGYQVEVFSEQEALAYFKSSSYEDCRINAYPPFTEYHGINRTPISLLMIDLDLNFGRQKDSKKRKILLERTLNRVFERIRKEAEGGIGGNPTVLWTGNGYHLYQSVSGFVSFMFIH
jgi:hypothetical protein